MLKLLKLYNKTTCSLYFSTSTLRHFSTAAKQNYYKLLGINEDASVAEIKTAFHKKAKEYHPDVQNANSTKTKEAEEKFKLVVEAYKTLTDEIKRKDYDETIKPKASPYTQQQSTDTTWQNKYKNSGYTYTRAKPNEKFYGNENSEFHNSNSGPSGSNYWEDPNSQQYQQYQPPPPNQKSRAFFNGLNYESLLVWGLVATFMARYIIFAFESDSSRPYSVEEKLDPFDEDEEGVFIQVQLPKDRSRALTLKECKGLTVEQLDELDIKGYTLPASIKEQVMEYRETHKVYKRNQDASVWNYNKRYNKEPPAPANNYFVPYEGEPEDEVQQRPKKPRRKPKTMSQVADDVKKDIIGNDPTRPEDIKPPVMGKTEPEREREVVGPSSQQQQQPSPTEEPESQNQNQSAGTGEVRIPRMKANMYHLEKRS